ncbi:DnaA regulatory inactivator Hda [Microbulbifer pacificus]|uniref:DnaA regulatory inactivator Hda n=1 Tax=Microbulbifer pacificus TaxID=407164 RepID=A0AAU0MYL2_9GAMM|nr:DnaA regulatory inactivator Hda [Microbulbifer pacificus]WOX05098.1 DnaA regulatory inactivator Hda [Microbulbifer pacificus]
MGESNQSGGVPQQLSLGVSLRDDATFANFFQSRDEGEGLEGSNRQIVGLLRAFASGDNAEPCIYIWGESGSGVTHLLQAVCQGAESARRGFQYLPLADLIDSDPEGTVEGLEFLDLVCIDDLHLIEKRRNWQTTLFHLYNRLRDSGRQLLIGSRKSPRGLKLELADLQSRLQWALIFQLHPLSDDDKLAALRQRSKLRGFDLPEDVAHYILHRAPRDTRALFACLEQLDRASLQAQRKITIPFVKQVLNI